MGSYIFCDIIQSIINKTGEIIMQQGPQNTIELLKEELQNELMLGYRYETKDFRKGVYKNINTQNLSVCEYNFIESPNETTTTELKQALSKMKTLGKNHFNYTQINSIIDKINQTTEPTEKKVNTKKNGI